MTDMIKQTPNMNIKRTGTTGGRWPRYNLIVNGVDVGSLRRYSAMTGWRIHGAVCASRPDFRGAVQHPVLPRDLRLDDREAAEQMLIKLAVRAGLLDERCL